MPIPPFVKSIYIIRKIQIRCKNPEQLSSYFFNLSLYRQSEKNYAIIPFESAVLQKKGKSKKHTSWNILLQNYFGSFLSTLSSDGSLRRQSEP